jgi:hypothetical protein
MPTPKKYESLAEKQKAYRERAAAARIQELQQKGLPAGPSIPSMPGTKRWDALKMQSLTALSSVVDEMRAYYEERTQTWQESERGEEFSEHLSEIEELCSSLESLLE